jgi:hypothetical protein
MIVSKFLSNYLRHVSISHLFCRILDRIQNSEFGVSSLHGLEVHGLRIKSTTHSQSWFLEQLLESGGGDRIAPVTPPTPPGSGSTPLPERADRLRQKQPAIHMRPAHHAFFNESRYASNLLAQAGPQP